MKLLYILSEYLPDSGGGIISYYAGVLPHLVAAGHDVQVLVASTAHLDRADLELEGVRVTYLKSASLSAASGGFERFRHGYPAFSAFLPVAWAAFHQAQGGKGFDLVETTDFPMLYAPWVAGDAQAPVNISLHGSPGQLDWHDRPGEATLDSDLLRLVEQAAFASAYSVQANSDANATFWENLTHRKIAVLLPSFKPGPLAASAKPSNRTGLVVGRLQLWKGPHVLCRALEQLPAVTMRWIGSDVRDPRSGDPFSQGLARDYPTIFGSRLLHQPGMPNNDVRREIAAADFLCVPSTWDVFNLTAVEAMSLGTPVICSTAAGASMLIRHAVSGFLFDPQQPEQLADAIRSLLSLSPAAREDLTNSARQTARERLDPTKLAAERGAFYENLIRATAKTPRDPWLASAISPRALGRSASNLLRSFTTGELLKGASHQVISGLRRRISGKPS